MNNWMSREDFMAKDTIPSIDFAHPSEEAKARLARLKAEKWPEEGKAERIAKALAAWNSRPPPPDLDPELIRYIAEDKDLEYE
jgi:hypothetical protein